jgi:hypothetical protein
MSCLRHVVYRWCIITLIIAHVSSRSCIITLIIAHVSIKNVMFETRRVSLVYRLTLIIAHVSLKNVMFEIHRVSLVYHHAHYRSCLNKKCHVWDTLCIAGVSSRSLSRAFKISRQPPELRRVPQGLPPVTLFRTWNINSAFLPPLQAFKQSYFSSTWSTL